MIFFGHIPFDGENVLRMLNTGDEDAVVELTIYYADADPVGPYRIEVKAHRLRVVRVNDLIDPLPVPLETDYAMEVRSSRYVIVRLE